MKYLTKEWYKKSQSCNEDQKDAEEKFFEYEKLKNNTFKNEELEYINISYLDCYIDKIIFDNGDIIFNFISGGLVEKENIIFKRCIVKLDESIEKTIWLEDEIYI